MEDVDSLRERYTSSINPSQLSGVLLFSFLFNYISLVFLQDISDWESFVFTHSDTNSKFKNMNGNNNFADGNGASDNGGSADDTTSRAPASAEHLLSDGSTMTTEQLAAILDKLQADLEEQRVRYQRTMEEQLERLRGDLEQAEEEMELVQQEEANRGAAEVRATTTTIAPMSDEEIIRTDPGIVHLLLCCLQNTYKCTGRLVHDVT